GGGGNRDLRAGGTVFMGPPPIARERDEQRTVPRCVARSQDADDGIPRLVHLSWSRLETTVVALKGVAELPVPGSLSAGNGFESLRREAALSEGKVGLAGGRVGESGKFWTDPEERGAIDAIAHG